MNWKRFLYIGINIAMLTLFIIMAEEGNAMGIVFVMLFSFAFYGYLIYTNWETFKSLYEMNKTSIEMIVNSWKRNPPTNEK